MDKRHNVNGRRFFFGFILLLLGLVMILHRAEIISYEVYDFLLSWQMLVVAIGALTFVGGNKGAGIVLMGVGAAFMLPDIFEDYFELRDYFWPIVFLGLGLLFMFGTSRSRRYRNHNKYQGASGPASPGSSHVSSDYFDEFVLFGAREISLSTPNLLGGKSTAIFGGTEIDLRQSQISDQGCTIELTTMFGGNVIKVPYDWTVLNKVTTIFGGYSDLRIKDPSYSPTPSKTIVITGVCIFGGTEVRNFSKAH